MPNIILLMLLLSSCYKAPSPSPPAETASGIEPPKPDSLPSDKTEGNAMAYGGQTYKITEIGSQTWFAENLNYKTEGSKCYGEGGKVQTVPDKPATETLSDNEVQANCAKYGRLYNWEAALDACPAGWRLPSIEDWDDLYSFINDDIDYKNPHYKNTGKYLKSVSSRLKAASGWDSDGNGTGDYGFFALPGGYGEVNGSFAGVGSIGLWWTSTELDFGYGYRADKAFYRLMDGHYFDEGVYKNFDKKLLFFSVRCIKD